MSTAELPPIAASPKIPRELTQLPQWVTWGFGATPKRPSHPDGYYAAADNPATWVPFARVQNLDRMGFVFSADGPYMGIDLDNAADDDGEFRDWAAEIVRRFADAGSLIEWSPSGRGVHIIFRGTLPHGCRKRVDIKEGERVEAYDSGHYFTVTGNCIGECPDTLPECSDQLAWLVETYLKPKPAERKAPPAERATPSDSAAVDRASKYLATMEPAISGSGGHDATFRAACKMVLGFDLNTDEAFHLLASEYNPRCVPPWSEKELQHKVESANKQDGERGYLLDDGNRPTLAPEVDLSGLGESEPEAEPEAKKPEPEAYPLTTLGSTALQSLIGKLQRGEGDILFDGGEAFEGFECGPGLLTMLGAGPGAGKTTLAMQYGIEVLRNHPDIRLTVANAETGFDRLLKRELTRRTGVPSRALRFAELTPEQLDQVEQAAAELEPLLARVDVFEPPFSLKRIEQLRNVAPGLFILDYLQKFSPRDMDARNGATAVAVELRNLCHAGWAVLALSATARTQGKSGSGHDSSKLTMASLKESGEIEFNADSVYLIRDQGETDEPHVRNVTLHCDKNRHGEWQSLSLIFDKPRTEFCLPAGSLLATDEFSEWGDDGSDPFGGGS